MSTAKINLRSVKSYKEEFVVKLYETAELEAELFDGSAELENFS